MGIDPQAAATLAAAQEQVRAAWVQAYGAIAGIFAAVLIPLGVYVAQRRADDFKAATRARDIALMISADISSWRAAADPHFEQLSSQGGLGEAMVIRSILDFEMLTRIPVGLRDRIPNLHELGRAARPVQSLVARYNDLVAAIPEMRRYADGNGMSEEQRVAARALHTNTLVAFFSALQKADRSIADLLKH